MFVQVIQGKVTDASAMQQRMEVWDREVKPGASGYLGSTAGVAADGTFIAAARFESPEAAQTNSDRAEQGEWWAETAKLFDGDPTFYDCTDVDEFRGGGSDDAGFVQVIQGYAKDKQQLKAMGQEMEQYMGDRRPDVIGGFVAWGPDDGFSQFIYFTSEAEARKAESESSDGGEGGNGGTPDWGDIVTDVKFIDLTDPWLAS
ncbi:MAG TPA: hypothetical protein VFK89_12195 [Actinomycetota bacterium]|nr:hypothetical protein [Actinomycetota bacterium]